MSRSGFQGLRYLVVPSYDKNALRMKEGMPACIMGSRMADFALTKSAVPSLLGLVGPGSSGVGCREVPVPLGRIGERQNHCIQEGSR